MITTRRLRKSLSVCGFALLLATEGFSATIASVGPANAYGRSLGSIGSAVYSFGWSQTGSYTNVAIRVDFLQDPTFPLDGSITGYLTDQVGPGTTMLSNEVSPTVTVPYAAGHSGLLTIFSGLSLGPGSYFVTVTSGGDGLWAFMGETGSPTVVVDAGVTLLDFGLDCCTPSSYLPAQVTPWVFSSWVFEVTGDPPGGGGEVPEPASAALVLGGLAALAVAHRKR